MKSKTITFSQEDLDKATKTGSKLKEHRDKQLNELIDDSPEFGSIGRYRGANTEEIILKVIKKKKRISASWLQHNLGMALRTAGYGLIRLKNKGMLKSEYKRIKGIDGSMRLTNVFSLVKKNGRKR